MAKRGTWVDQEKINNEKKADYKEIKQNVQNFENSQKTNPQKNKNSNSKRS